MKYVTFNIRVDVGEENDGINAFNYRKALIREKLLEEKPDIIGFQEVLPHVAEWLQENLPGYYVVGCGREADLKGEQMSVAFRMDRFNLIQMETFWMSETPYIPGSRYEHQSKCPRTCTELVLFDRVRAQVMRVINTHLDHIDPEARLLGLNHILNKIKENKLFPDAPIILSGDFNAEPQSKEIALFNNFPEFTNQTENVGITYHGFTDNDTPESIDFVYTTGNFKKLSMSKWTDVKDGVYLSDHYPVCVLFED